MFLYQTFYNFRNLKNDTIDLSSREVYFVGENGQGKSNLLESLYYSAYGTSFRTHNESQIIKNGEKAFSVNSMFKKSDDDMQKITLVFENGKKRIDKNGKRIQDRKELINTIPCILFCHDDMKFAIGEPECRRFFIDQSLTLYDNLYIDDIRNYKKILKSRNLILKNHQYDLLETFDSQLAYYGLIIQEKRKKAIFQFNEIFGKIFYEVTGIEGVKIVYEPSWKEIITEKLTADNKIITEKNFPASQDIINLLLSRQELDKRFETSMSGPHRDKINFIKDKVLFVPTASTGQRRLLSLILRIAQSIYYTRVTGLKPVLLMDDVLLELDPDKRAKINSLLPEYEQLFCTFLPGEPYERYMKDTTKVYNIKGGEWFERSN
ncbi:MAG: DNA replication and repair protein RecF [Treponema sp.]|nr:DNA replication/repair protein RecF [Treponema sp.]MDD7768297.1 DNA replication and repair protein RecF [Treponema sp.]MDY3131642.1 DNA replication and repair protein RecF [Treponema sp.]